MVFCIPTHLLDSSKTAKNVFEITCTSLQLYFSDHYCSEKDDKWLKQNKNGNTNTPINNKNVQFQRVITTVYINFIHRLVFLRRHSVSEFGCFRPQVKSWGVATSDPVTEVSSF
jgi:hypothetical protein